MALTQLRKDNPHRRDRAQQLSNDCQSAQANYKQACAQIAAALAPVRAKLQFLQVPTFVTLT